MARSPRQPPGAVIALALGALLGLAPRVAAEGPPMHLPVTARWCLGPSGASPCISLEVPKGERQYAWGLQQRPRLPALRGMWFRFDPPVPARFWMHRTPEPLDMLFLRQGRIVAIAAAATPCPRLPCRSYGPEEPVDGVVELAAGEAARLGLVVGGPAAIEPLPPPPARVSSPPPAARPSSPAAPPLSSGNRRAPAPD